jgi:hypothetical protein
MYVWRGLEREPDAHVRQKPQRTMLCARPTIGHPACPAHAKDTHAEPRSMMMRNETLRSWGRRLDHNVGVHHPKIGRQHTWLRDSEETDTSTSTSTSTSTISPHGPGGPILLPATRPPKALLSRGDAPTVLHDSAVAEARTLGPAEHGPRLPDTPAQRGKEQHLGPSPCQAHETHTEPQTPGPPGPVMSRRKGSSQKGMGVS